MTKTAAGELEVIKSAFSPVRGGTKLFLGMLPDGRYVVASRFQIEIRTANRSKAEAVYSELCNG